MFPHISHDFTAHQTSVFLGGSICDFDCQFRESPVRPDIEKLNFDSIFLNGIIFFVVVIVKTDKFDIFMI